MLNIFTFQEVLKNRIIKFRTSIAFFLTRDRFDVDRIFENFLVIVSLYLFLSGKAHKYFENFSIIKNMYLYPLLFDFL